MKNLKTKNLIIKLACDIDKAETLSRVLVEAIREGGNLRCWDVENLSVILKDTIINLHKDINNLEAIL